ncbi:hypothetical protein [Bradyrhizobium sp. 604_D8_N2_3]|uniref:hypothetical protein n=1 Tax=Bradyrhizobium sp. 604_D8_N2_3 TaxID=3240370 RepID=UPI003F2635B1
MALDLQNVHRTIGQDIPKELYEVLFAATQLTLLGPPILGGGQRFVDRLAHMVAFEHDVRGHHVVANQALLKPEGQSLALLAKVVLGLEQEPSLIVFRILDNGERCTLRGDEGDRAGEPVQSALAAATSALVEVRHGDHGDAQTGSRVGQRLQDFPGLHVPVAVCPCTPRSDRR